jgi:hypothetical protein
MIENWQRRKEKQDLSRKIGSEKLNIQERIRAIWDLALLLKKESTEWKVNPDVERFTEVLLGFTDKVINNENQGKVSRNLCGAAIQALPELCPYQSEESAGKSKQALIKLSRLSDTGLVEGAKAGLVKIEELEENYINKNFEVK